MNIESLDKSKEMLRKGEAYLAEQDYAAAEKTFREYSDLLPGESDGWWGILRSRTKNMKNVVFSKTDLDGGLASLADRALKTAWGEDQQKKTERLDGLSGTLAAGTSPYRFRNTAEDLVADSAERCGTEQRKKGTRRIHPVCQSKKINER